MTKVVVRVMGGLGNQLFCFAAARRLALTNNAELVVDDVSGFAYDAVYQRHYQLEHFNIPCRKGNVAERLEPFSWVRRYLNRRWNQRLPFAQRAYLVQAGIVDFDQSLLHFKPKGKDYLNGYWQVEDYFKNVLDTLRQDLQITPPIYIDNLAIAAWIGDCMAVAVQMHFLMNLTPTASITLQAITISVPSVIHET